MPLYTHENPEDQFIKTEDGKDYYLHKSDNVYGGWSLVIRHSSEPGDYEGYNAGWFDEYNLQRKKFQKEALVLLHFLAGTNYKGV